MSQIVRSEHCILICDDDARLRRALSHELRRRGFETIEAVDGRAGLEMARHHDPCVIVTDVMMPNLDGLGLIKGLRDLGSQIPVVVMTGHPSLTRALEAGRLGVQQFIAKPLDMGKLQEMLQRAVKRAE